MKLLVVLLLFVHSFALAEEVKDYSSGPYRQRVLNVLWKGALGQRFFSFMMSPMTKEQTIEASENLTSFIFSDQGIWVNRLSALQMLTENLYDSDLIMDDDRLRRLILLQGNIWQVESDLQVSYPGRGLVRLGVIEFLLSLPAGSPEFRKILNSNAFYLWKNVLLQKEEPACRIPLTGMNRKTFTSNYSFKEALIFFLKVFGTTSGLYLVKYDLDRTLRSDSITQMLSKVDSDEKFEKLLIKLSVL